MAFCGKCGREVPAGDAFCRECGAPLAQPEPQVAPSAPPPPPPPPVAAPQAPPVPPAAAAHRFPVWAIVLIGVLVLVLAGGAAGFFAFTQLRGGSSEVSSEDPGSLGFDAEPFNPAATVVSSSDTGFDEPTSTSEPEATNPEPPAEEMNPEPAPDLSGLVPAKEPTQEESVDVVGNMLNYMHLGKESKALALVTKNMLKDVNNDKTWFSPGPDILISFEVQDATKKGDEMKVRVLEQWNSGPEKTTYYVVIKDGKHKVDGIKWSSW